MAENQQKSEVAKREEEVLAFWDEREIFKKSIEKEALKGEYVFYDGPPFATGLPHYGHIVASVLKDVVPRYRTMQGYRVPRVWGWDCHGLPIENIVEKELGFKHKKDIRAYGIEKFNEMCRQRVLTYVHEWERIIPRIGRWADMEHAYKTMDMPFMESVWWVFKSIYDKGLVYEDYRVMHICPRCETTLSQQEVSEGYKDVKDIAVSVSFKLKNPEKIGLSGEVYLLAWTTTPWTLPGNVALAVGEGIIYRVFERDGKKYIAALDRSESLGIQDQKMGHQFMGKELVGLEYEPLFDYYVTDEHLKNRENGWKVYAADFVTADEGTGIAHEAPAFGADDWALLKKYNLPFVQHVNYDGTFKPEVKAFAGMEVKPLGEDSVRLAADIAVLKYLQEHGFLFAKQNIVHSYPHCWRCDSPLLNYATSSWFVKVEEQKVELLKNAEPINWSPEHVKSGRWGKWLEGARDWSISRQRFWASVLPIWVCETCKEKRVFGSAAELEAASGKKVTDLHKHVVDEILVPCACGGSMKRVPDVLDTWFDSGSMPYGEEHYPFENKESFEHTFPAQFIAEGQDQTRAWFYYLHLLGTSLFDKNAFQNVIVNGIVLAEDGKKMSKRLQNYPDPMEVVEKYGADALRLYLLASPVMQAENLNFSEKGVAEWKGVLTRLENVLSFYQLYRNELVHEASDESAQVLDRWIVARLRQTQAEVTSAMEAYNLTAATRPFAALVDDLSTWYLRRSRDRIKGDDEADKKAALATTLYVLREVSKLIAPFAPFVADYIWQALKETGDVESVHLAHWPSAPSARFLSKLFGGAADQNIEHMTLARGFVTQALEAREKAGIKVRQPLSLLTIPADSNLPEEYFTIVAEEVNVKRVESKGETVALDTNLTDELREEGVVRDAIREIQSFRKERGLKPGEHATYKGEFSDVQRKVIEKNLDLIQKATTTTIEL
ncbi:MAG: isoleucine--tRNA ligase [Candidatus Pacebacteria bacterium]|nr:isoleucine--tRNA ligase [Candidatus Paceibacterota bacterium]